MALAQRRSPATPSKAILKDFLFEEHYGVSRLSDELTTPDKFFWEIKNGYVSKRNWIEQRNGHDDWSADTIGASTKIRKLFEFENKTGGRTIIARGGSAWYRYDSNGNATALDSGRGSDVKGQCAQFNNELVMCDGGAPRKSDASWSVSNVGASAPSLASAVHTHNHRVIMNSDSNFLEAYCSKVDSLDFDTTGNDAIILNLSKIIPEGDRIVGFSSFGVTFLVIWLTRNIVIYDLSTVTDEISLNKVIRGLGCISYDGIIYSPDGDIWFPSESGYKSLKEVYVTQQTASIGNVTALIDPYFRSAIQSVSDKTDINGIFYRRLNHGYFTFPFASAPETWVVSKDLQESTNNKGNIAGHFTGITSYSFVERKNGDLLFGSSDGRIYKMDFGTNDNGSAISFSCKKTGLYFGNPKVFKAPKEFEMLLEASASLTAYLDYSYGTQDSFTGVQTEPIAIDVQNSYWDEALWDVSYWDAAGQKLHKSRNMLGRGKVINVELRHNTLNAQIKFPYWIFSMIFMGDK